MKGLDRSCGKVVKQEQEEKYGETRQGLTETCEKYLTIIWIFNYKKICQNDCMHCLYTEYIHST